jgi:hypothetical protein
MTKGSDEVGEGGYEELHLDFPIVFLDVGDTLPPFRDIVADYKQ